MWLLAQPFVVFFFSLSLLSMVLWLAYLDAEVREKFEGKRWALPAKVYSRPLELYAGLPIKPSDLLSELRNLHYRQKEINQSLEEGEFRYKVLSTNEMKLTIYTRGFNFSDGVQAAEQADFLLNNNVIAGASHAILRLEPQLIGGIYPRHNEDRVLIKLEQTPPYMIETLVLVEDREFFNHYGVSPKAIARAALVNLVSGRYKQGGSTLTQQLVKNFYLSNERTLLRKVNEAFMALLLELHYNKNEILEAYLNEVNLGQNGRFGIHGFGLASQHYFGQDIENLDVHQIALLVALVKGPSYYEPRRNPERALERRNLVLELMIENGFLSREKGNTYIQKSLGLTEDSILKHKQFPAFLQLVNKQLQADYSGEDLQSEGLRIFTSFDPIAQEKAETAMIETIGRLRNESAPNLQGAMLVVSPENGEVLALVAGADVRSGGFNRVLDARRSIGSLVKPAVYLSALKADSYHWASILDDSEIFVDKQGHLEQAENQQDILRLNKDEDIWSPKNFDKKVHGVDGKVSMLEAMSRSYNQATVRLGLSIGVDQVIKTLRQLGLQQKPQAYPSLLLGTLELTPFEVTQLYQTIANGGFNTPLNAIREVQAVDGALLNRYPFKLVQVLDSQNAYLIHAGLQEVVRSGTAASLNKYLDSELGLAGKTGTGNEQRDNWFVAYSGNMLATVWVGNDDNSQTPYTGASAALKVWTHLAINYPLQANQRQIPQGIEWVWISVEEQKLAEESCEGAIRVPLKQALIPQEKASCARSKASGFKRIFGF